MLQLSSKRRNVRNLRPCHQFLVYQMLIRVSYFVYLWPDSVEPLSVMIYDLKRLSLQRKHSEAGDSDFKIE